MSTPPDSPATPRPIDMAEVARVVAALEIDLARVKSGSADVEALRREVEALRILLGTATGDVDPERLHQLRGLLGTATDTLEVDAFKAAGYFAQVGRILGMS